MKQFMIGKILFLFLFIPFLSYADWAADYFNDMKNNSQLRGASEVHTHGSISYNGGGWTWQGGNAVLKPFSAKAPSINAGCSGISVDFGAFSLMDEESLIEFLRALGDAAPGYAFELGLQILCPSCLDIMNTLNQIANTLNNAQLDACGTLKAVGGMIDKAVYTATDGKLGSGQSNSFKDAVDKYIIDPLKTVDEYLNKAFKCISGQACPIDFFKGKQSFQEQIVHTLRVNNSKQYNYIASVLGVNTEQEMASYLAGMAGDVLVKVSEGYQSSDKTADNKKNYNKSSGKGNMSLMPVDPIYGISNIKAQELIHFLAYGEKEIPAALTDVPNETVIAVYEYKKDNKGQFTDNCTEIAQSNSIKTLQFLANTHLDIITETFKDRRKSLGREQLNFLASFKTPVYKIMNMYSVSDMALKSFSDSFKTLAASQMVYEFFSLLSTHTTPAISKFRQQVISADLNTNELDKGIDNVTHSYSLLSAEAYKLYVKSYDEFSKKLQDSALLIEYQKMQKATMARHPVMNSGFMTPTIGR